MDIERIKHVFFVIITSLSIICQLVTSTPFIVVATILSGVRKSLKRSRIKVLHDNLLCV